MECPECGGKTVVVESREFLGAVYRRRKCKKCGFRFQTEEIEMDKPIKGLSKFITEKYRK